MKIICIIPARGGSKGIPNKNLIELDGLPLVCHSLKQALASEWISDVYVSSDSDEILETSINCGALGIKRPIEISGDKASPEEALKHALNDIGDVDYVVYLQPTSPLREVIDIDQSISTTLLGEYDSVFSAVELGDMFVWHQKENGLTSINYDHDNRKRRQDIKEEYFIENGSIYVFKPSVLLKYNNRIGGNIGKYVMGKNKLLEIDDMEDYLLCKYYLETGIWKD